MTDIFDLLVQEIERSASPRFQAAGEYRRERFQALVHMNWLREHLDEEEMAHLERAQEADLRLEALEREAITRAALAVGIRLALSC